MRIPVARRKGIVSWVGVITLSIAENLYPTPSLQIIDFTYLFSLLDRLFPKARIDAGIASETHCSFGNKRTKNSNSLWDEQER